MPSLWTHFPCFWGQGKTAKLMLTSIWRKPVRKPANQPGTLTLHLGKMAEYVFVFFPPKWQFRLIRRLFYCLLFTQGTRISCSKIHFGHWVINGQNWKGKGYIFCSEWVKELHKEEVDLWGPRQQGTVCHSSITGWKSWHAGFLFPSNSNRVTSIASYIYLPSRGGTLYYYTVLKVNFVRCRRPLALFFHRKDTRLRLWSLVPIFH